MCPNSKTKYVRCPTLIKAKEILGKTTFNSPKTFIFHCGTNDSETTPSDNVLVNNALDIIGSLQTNHPTAKIIFSSLLPRNDSLNKRMEEINQKLENATSDNKNVLFVKHNNIKKENDLKDKSHRCQEIRSKSQASFLQQTNKKNNPKFHLQQTF